MQLCNLNILLFFQIYSDLSRFVQIYSDLFGFIQIYSDLSRLIQINRNKFEFIWIFSNLAMAMVMSQSHLGFCPMDHLILHSKVLPSSMILIYEFDEGTFDISFKGKTCGLLYLCCYAPLEYELDRRQEVFWGSAKLRSHLHVPDEIRRT